MSSSRHEHWISLAALLAFMTVLALGCGAEDPIAPSPDRTRLPFEAAPTTVIIPLDESAAILGLDEEGTLTLDASSRHAAAAGPGDIVVGRSVELAPAGFLREVVSKESDGGQVILETRPALLHEAFVSMAVLESHRLRPSQITKSELHDGTRIVDDPEDGTLILDFDVLVADGQGDPQHKENQTRCRGRFSLRPELYTRIGIAESQLEAFELWIDTNEETRLDLSPNAHWEFEQPLVIRLAQLELQPLPVAGVVWVTPVLELELRIEGDLTVSGEAGIRYTQATTLGLSHENEGAPESQSIRSVSSEFVFTPPVLRRADDAGIASSLRTRCLVSGIDGLHLEESTALTFDSVLGGGSCDTHRQFDISARLDGLVEIRMEGEALGLDWGDSFPLHHRPLASWVLALAGTARLDLRLQPDTLEAPWSVLGPCGYASNGFGPATLEELSEGDYMVSWGTIAGWTAPPPARITLGSGESQSLDAVYIESLERTIPVACFTVDPPSGIASTDFSFDASCSEDLDQPPGGLEYRWDWEADGTWDHPSAGGYSASPLATHQFPTARIEYVQLEVRDADGDKNSRILPLVIADEPDTTPPAAITDLRPGELTPESIELVWTAPGGDGDVGKAFQYDLRYSDSEDVLRAWDLAIQVDREPAPSSAGSTDRYTVIGLEAGTQYHFGLRAVDRAGNWSELPSPTQVISAPDPRADAYEPNDYAEVATNLPLGRTQAHSIIPKMDIDWFRFRLTAPSNLLFSVSGTTDDVRLMLYFQDTQGILREAWYGPLRGSANLDTESINLPPGQYFLKVWDLGQAQEVPTYHLRIEATILAIGFDDPYIHEPNDSKEQSQIIQPRVQQEHAIAPATDEDWFRFSIPEAADLVVDMTGRGGYLNHAFFREETDGSLMPIVAHGEFLRPSSYYSKRTKRNVPAGDYFLRMHTTGDYRMIGKYRIWIDVQSLHTGLSDPYAYEPNDTREEAGAITLGVPQDHARYPARDFDWFSFVLPSAGDLTVQLAGRDGRLTAFLHHVGPDGDLFDVWEEGYSFWLSGAWVEELKNQPAGEYFLRLGWYQDSEIIGHYQVQVDHADFGLGPLDPFLGEPNDQSHQATQIDANVSQDQTIAPVRDVDWFRFQVPTASDLQIRSSGFGGFLTGELFFEKQGGELSPVWDMPKIFYVNQSGGSHNLGTSLNMPAGNYLLRWTEYGNNAMLGHYGFTPEVTDLGMGFVEPYAYEPNGTRGQYTPIEAGVPQDHSIVPIGDADWVRIEVTTPSDLLISTSGSSGVLSAILYMENEDGGVTALWSTPQTFHVDSDDDAFNHRTVTGLTPGFYFLSIYDEDRDEMLGHYRLEMDLSASAGGNP